MKLDKLDTNILTTLIGNSRLSLVKIKEKCPTNAISTLRDRIKRLEKEGIIKDYTISVDLEKLNYIPVMIFLKSKKEIIPEILANKVVFQSVETEDQLILITYFKSLFDLRKELFSLHDNGYQFTYSLVKKNHVFTHFDLLRNTKLSEEE